MILKLARVLSGAALGYIAYRRYADGDFSAVSMGRCKSSAKGVLENIKGQVKEAWSEAEQEMAEEAKAAKKKVAKAVSKEV